MVPLEKSTKNHKQKWYHFRKVPKFSNKKGTIGEKYEKSKTKLVPLQ